MKNILIIGCGLIGSSLLRAVHAQKVSNNISGLSIGVSATSWKSPNASLFFAYNFTL